MKDIEQMVYEIVKNNSDVVLLSPQGFRHISFPVDILLERIEDK